MQEVLLKYDVSTDFLPVLYSFGDAPNDVEGSNSHLREVLESVWRWGGYGLSRFLCSFGGGCRLLLLDVGGHFLLGP